MLATWGTSTGRNPTLDLQFAGATSLDNRITFSRGSQATLFDSTGALVYAPNNMIRNNTMVGVVAGTPGTLPTNWTGNATVDGLSREIVGAGVENGINYVDVRFSGTSGTGGNSTLLTFESQTEVVASNGQTWAASAYVKLVAGSLANVALFALGIRYNNSGGTSLTAQNTTLTPTATLTRYTSAFAATDATTEFVNSSLVANFTDNSAVDLTLRIGMPQLELNSVATAVNATSGTAYYGPRFDYNPDTLAAQGLLIEEQRTNSIRNNTMQGAVAGTPGTLPTNWSVPTTAGLTTNVIGTGTSGGITYIDLQVTGTTSGTSYILVPEAATQIAALNGQTWAMSAWWSIVSGDFTNVTAANFDIRELDAGGVQLASGAISVSLPTATFTRISATRTNTNASTAFVQPRFRFTVNNTSAVNFTLRIGLPQLEEGEFATSVIPTTTTALTRNADVASMTGTNFSSWFNPTEGTLFVEASTAAAADTYIFADINSGVTNNYIRQSTSSSGTTTQFVVQVTGSTVAAPGVAATLGSSRKMAGAYILDSIQQAVNGTLGTEDTSAAIPTGMSQMNLGSRAGSLNDTQIWLARIAYYPTRLPDTTLQALTA